MLLGIPEELTATVEAELLQLYDRLFTIAGDERLRNELRKQRDVLAVKEWMQRKDYHMSFIYVFGRFLTAYFVQIAMGMKQIKHFNQNYQELRQLGKSRLVDVQGS